MQLAKIVGQKIAVSTLERAVKNDRIAHSYLFHGDSGVGKRTTAISFINHLLCERKTACGECGACKKFLHGNHPGYRLVESNASIKIGQMREVKEKAQYRKDNYVIWLINDAHKMTLQAANSFLKLLEEPPEKTLFILVTNNLGQILPTIRSRCQPISFIRLSNDDVEMLLQEKGNVDQLSKNDRDLVVSMARGSIGKALELLDSPIVKRRKWIVEKLIDIPNMNVAQVLGLSHNWEENREIASLDLELMLQWYRDLWCLKNGTELALFNEDYKKQLTVVSKQYSGHSLAKITSQILEMLTQLKRNVRVRFILGHLLIQMRREALN